MKSGEQAQNKDAQNPLQIPGDILDIVTYDAFAVITDEDIQQIPETWARVVAERYANLISAQSNEEKP